MIAVGEPLWISWCTLSAGKVVLCERVRTDKIRRRAGVGWRGAAAMRLDRKVSRLQADYLDGHLCHLPGIQAMTVLTTAYQTLHLPLCVIDDITLPDMQGCFLHSKKNVPTVTATVFIRDTRVAVIFPLSFIRSLLYVRRINEDEFGKKPESFDSLGF